MKTSICQLLAYCETSGGPVCVAPLQEAEDWLGTESELSLYHNVCAQIGTNIWFQYGKINFFNSEIGNFVLFRSSEELIIAELISLEEHASMPWNGIAFSIEENSDFEVTLEGLTCFFDSSITVANDLTTNESLMNIGGYGTWNCAVLNCSFSKGRKVAFETSEVHLEGLSFYN